MSRSTEPVWSNACAPNASFPPHFLCQDKMQPDRRSCSASLFGTRHFVGIDYEHFCSPNASLFELEERLVGLLKRIGRYFAADPRLRRKRQKLLDVETR